MEFNDTQLVYATYKELVKSELPPITTIVDDLDIHEFHEIMSAYCAEWLYNGETYK